MIGNLKRAAGETARRTAIGTAGIVCALTGLAFLTSAAWMALSALRDAQFAALVIGLGYLGLGAILLGFSAARRPVPARRIDDAPSAFGGNSPAVALAAAFAEGLSAGAAAGKRRRTGASAR